MNTRVEVLMDALRAVSSDDWRALADPELNDAKILLNARAEEVNEEYERRSREAAGLGDPDAEVTLPSIFNRLELEYPA